jgi:chaperonin GroEL (HSP60 family)
LALDTVNRLGNYCLTPWFHPDYSLKIELIPGALIQDSRIINGTIIGKEPVNLSLIPPSGIKNPRIMLVRQKLYLDLPDGGKAGPQGFEMEMRFSNGNDIQKLHEQVQKFAEDALMCIEKVSPSVIITEKGVDRHLETLLNKKGIILIRRAKTEDFEYLARFLDVKIIENFKAISADNICTAESLNYEKIGRDYQIIIRNSKLASRFDTGKERSKNVENIRNLENMGNLGDIYSIPPIGTILICGSMWDICEEVKRLYLKLVRSLIDLIKNNTFFYGGGNVELSFTQFLKDNGSFSNHVTEHKSKIIYCRFYSLSTEADARISHQSNCIATLAIEKLYKSQRYNG